MTFSPTLASPPPPCVPSLFAAIAAVTGPCIVAGDLIPDQVRAALVIAYVDARVSCPSCGTLFAKTVFQDGDTDTCRCGTAVWFELLSGTVIAHPEQHPAGSTLNDLLQRIHNKDRYGLE